MTSFCLPFQPYLTAVPLPHFTLDAQLFFRSQTHEALSYIWVFAHPTPLPATILSPVLAGLIITHSLISELSGITQFNLGLPFYSFVEHPKPFPS